MSNLMVFNNENFGQVRTVNIEGKPYFVGKDIAEALGYKLPRKAISDHCKGVIKREVSTNGGKQTMSVIPEDDVYRLIGKAKTIGNGKKNSLLNSLGLSKDKFVIESRREINFKSTLFEILSPMHIDIECQKDMFDGKYKIDFYIPKYNLAIEYDEEQHQSHQTQDKIREFEIKQELNCKFIRLDYRNTDNYNVGLIINEILKSEVR